MKKENNSKIYVVGIGPGAYEMMTIQAVEILRSVDLIVGYQVYIDLIKEHFPDKEYLSTPMKREVERCKLAFAEAKKGKKVAMISSGDAGIYGMAGLMYEVANQDKVEPEKLTQIEIGQEKKAQIEEKAEEAIEIIVIPGITAASSGAALLGAPLIHDFSVISLSDLLTPWEKIEKRIAHAAQADMGIVLYNPSSIKRADHLQKACDILLQFYPQDRICGIVENIGREGSKTTLCSLGELRDMQVNMFTTVFIGNAGCREIDGHMVTERGYQLS